MSYCTGKNIEIARGKAMKMLVIERKPVGIIADRFGVNRSTIWRWLSGYDYNHSLTVRFKKNVLGTTI